MTEQQLDFDEFAALAEEADELGLDLTELPPVRRTTVATADGEVSALVWGVGDPELVLLHGAGLNAHTWDGVLLALERPAVAIDLPGHGHSQWRADGRYDPAVIAVAAGEAIAELAPGARGVVGQSLGGLTTIALGAQRPELVRHQLLVDAIPSRPLAPDNQVVSFLSGPTSFASREEIVSRAREFGFGRSLAAVQRGVALNTRRQDDGRWVWRHHFGQGIGARLDPDFTGLWEPLERYAGPVTVFRATAGFLNDEQLAELRRRRPSAEIETVVSGHNIQEDDPVLLAELLQRSLDGQPAGATAD